MSDNGADSYKEIYQGCNGRPSLMVRMERAENQIAGLIKVMDRVAYIATAVLIAVIVGSGALVANAVIQQNARGSASVSASR